MKALRRYEPGTLTHNDLVELTRNLKKKAATDIFERLGVTRYMRHGQSYATPGLVAIEGLPKKAPVRLINDDHWYSAEELLDIWIDFASDYELSQITR